MENEPMVTIPLQEYRYLLERNINLNNANEHLKEKIDASLCIMCYDIQTIKEKLGITNAT